MCSGKFGACQILDGWTGGLDFMFWIVVKVLADNVKLFRILAWHLVQIQCETWVLHNLLVEKEVMLRLRLVCVLNSWFEDMMSVE